MFVLTQARYQLFRHRGRTLLMLALSALLAACVCLYIGNYRRQPADAGFP